MLPEGPRGETPIPVDPTRREPAPSAVRQVIMAKDADEYTSVGDANRRTRS
jgi:hypothetical protein